VHLGVPFYGSVFRRIWCGNDVGVYGNRSAAEQVTRRGIFLE